MENLIFMAFPYVYFVYNMWIFSFEQSEAAEILFQGKSTCFVRSSVEEPLLKVFFNSFALLAKR